jgi:prepilin-type N-terminal cleavage/methylation domain-containing protein
MRRSRGFTLIEVIVALAIGALVLATGREVLGGALDGMRRLTEARRAQDAQANARRMLTTAIGSIDLHSEGAAAFRGLPSAIEFSAWFDRSGSVPVLRPFRIDADEGPAVMRVAATRVALWPDARGLAVDYLLTPGAREVWATEWVSTESAPVGIRLRVDRGSVVDTVLILVGPRG